MSKIPEILLENEERIKADNEKSTCDKKRRKELELFINKNLPKHIKVTLHLGMRGFMLNKKTGEGMVLDYGFFSSLTPKNIDNELEMIVGFLNVTKEINE